MRSAALVVSLLPSLSAQATWIVDANNGPGTNFTDLPPAVAAAAPGDEIVVRGVRANFFYGATIVTRGLSLRGEGTSPQIGVGFGVRALPAGETFVARGLAFLGLDVTLCVGAVHLEEASLLGAVTVTDSPHVAWTGTNGIGSILSFRASVTRSTLTLEDCLLGTPGSQPMPPLVLNQSQLFAARTTIRGQAETVSCLGGCTTLWNQSPAVNSISSIMHFGRDCVLEGGQRLVSDPSATPPVTVTCIAETVNGTGQLFRDASTQIQCVVRPQVVARHLPDVVCSPLVLGQAAMVDVRTDPGRPALVFASLPLSTWTRFSFGEVLADPGVASPLAIGIADPQGHLQTSLQVPAQLRPHSLFVFQGAVLDGSGGLLVSFAAQRAVRRP